MFKPEDVTDKMLRAHAVSLAEQAGGNNAVAIAAAINARPPCVWKRTRAHDGWMHPACMPDMLVHRSMLVSRMKFCCYCGAPLQEGKA